MSTQSIRELIADIVNYDGGNGTWARSVAEEILSVIPRPERPTEPDIEDLGSIPDQEHTWGADWDQEVHYGRICSVCRMESECAACEPDPFHGVDCLREQARSRNFKRTCAHRAAMQRYEAQMDYYRTLTGETA